MWFKWKTKAIQLQQQNTALQATNTQQLEHIQQLQEARPARKTLPKTINANCSLTVVYPVT